MRPSARVALAALCITGVRGESQKPISVEDEGVRGSPFTKEYEKHVGKLLEEWHVPGVAVGIVDGDNIWTEVGFVTSLHGSHSFILMLPKLNAEWRAIQLEAPQLQCHDGLSVTSREVGEHVLTKNTTRASA